MSAGYGVDHPVFWIDRCHPHGLKQHPAFVAKSYAEIDAFYVAALRRAAQTTARREFAAPPRVIRRAITPSSFSILTVTHIEAFFRRAVPAQSNFGTGFRMSDFDNKDAARVIGTTA
jgi:hypothetical protein